MVRRAKATTRKGGRGTKTEAKWGGISSAAVERATGKSWEQWCGVLDKDKASSLTHTEIAKLVHEKHGVGDWWSQMVTVGYEQARGLREKHQVKSGWAASVSRTLPVTMSAAFEAVSDATQRAKWLKGDYTVTKALPGKSVRIAWGDGSRVVVAFWDKTRKLGGAKTQVVFQHEKLTSAGAVAKSKKYWADRIEALERMLARVAV